MHNLYSIYDKIGQEYAPPFVAKNDGVATRNYLMAIKNVAQSEFELVKVGQWNSETGMLIPIEIPTAVTLTTLGNSLEGI